MLLGLVRLETTVKDKYYKFMERVLPRPHQKSSSIKQSLSNS